MKGVFPTFFFIHAPPPLSYNILAAKEMNEAKDDKNCAKACFDKVGLDAELYRTGNTKVLEDIIMIFGSYLDYDRSLVPTHPLHFPPKSLIHPSTLLEVTFLVVEALSGTETLSYPTPP